MRKIYVVNGLPESGKTEFGKKVGEELARNGVNFLHTSSINPVKKALMAESTWDTTLTNDWFVKHQLKRLKAEVTDQNWSGREEDKTPYWRNAMSELKAKINGYNPTLIHRIVINEIQQLRDPFVALVDIREPENIEGFKEYCNDTQVGFEVEKVLLKSDKSIRVENRSDLSVNETKYDIIVENPRRVFVDDSISLWFLRARARTFVEQEILEGRQKERFY